MITIITMHRCSFFSCCGDRNGKCHSSFTCGDPTGARGACLSMSLHGSALAVIITLTFLIDTGGVSRLRSGRSRALRVRLSEFEVPKI